MDRTKGIGGSDAAAVLGLSPWATRLDVYLEKIGESKPTPDNGAMARGRALEPIVADMAEPHIGKLLPLPGTIRHRDHEHMVGHIDRVLPDNSTALAELKTAWGKTDEWGEPGTDQIPIQYAAQAHHYLTVLDFELCYVPVLFLRDWRLEIYEVHRDQQISAGLIQQEADFWHDHVIARNPPAPETPADVRRRWPTSHPREVETDADVTDALRRLAEVKHQQRELKTEREAIEAEVQTYMQDAGTLTNDAGKPLATWLTQTSRRLDAKALQAAEPEVASRFTNEIKSRVFRLKERNL